MNISKSALRRGIPLMATLTIAMAGCTEEEPGTETDTNMEDTGTDAAGDATADVADDTAVDATADTDPDTMTDAVDDTATDVVDDTATDVVDDTATDVVDDATTDVVDDTATDVVDDAATDVVDDTATDVGTDTGTDVPTAEQLAALEAALDDFLGGAYCEGAFACGAEAAANYGSVEECLAETEGYGAYEAGEIAELGVDCVAVATLYIACINDNAACYDVLAGTYFGVNGDECADEEAAFDAACGFVESVFVCDDGVELEPEFECNGTDDCVDGSDEADCIPDLFLCDDGEFIDLEFYCDGDDDCVDASDEADCPVFTCTDGETIPADYECDGDADCVDASDEADCL